MAGQPAVNFKMSKKTAIAFVAAQLFVIALLWTVFSGGGDRDGRIKAALAAGKAGELQSAVAKYYSDNGMLPADNKALSQPGKQGKSYFTLFAEQGQISFRMDVASGVITLTFAENQEPVSGRTMVFVPRVSNGKLEWSCNAGTVDAKYLPPQCSGK